MPTLLGVTAVSGGEFFIDTVWLKVANVKMANRKVKRGFIKVRLVKGDSNLQKIIINKLLYILNLIVSSSDFR